MEAMKNQIEELMRKIGTQNETSQAIVLASAASLPSHESETLHDPQTSNEPSAESAETPGSEGVME